MLFSESVVGWTSSDSDLVYPRPSDQDELITAGASDSHTDQWPQCFCAFTLDAGQTGP